MKNLLKELEARVEENKKTEDIIMEMREYTDIDEDQFSLSRAFSSMILSSYHLNRARKEIEKVIKSLDREKDNE